MIHYPQWKNNVVYKSAEKIGRPSEGAAEGGCGGNSAAPEPKRSPAALLGQSRSQQKSFLFLLEEKIGARKIRKSEENFFAGWRALASGGGAERVSFAQSRFGFRQTNAPISKFQNFLSQTEALPPKLYCGAFFNLSKPSFIHTFTGLAYCLF